SCRGVRRQPTFLPAAGRENSARAASDVIQMAAASVKSCVLRMALPGVCLSRVPIAGGNVSHRWSFVALTTLLALGGPSTRVLAQTSPRASLVVTVVDPSGAVL